MKTIWNRLSERTAEEWRHVYKSLLLLDYMLKNGSYQVVTDAQAHVSVLRALGDYTAYEGGDDKGISGRFSCLFTIIGTNILIIYLNFYCLNFSS